MVHEVYGGFLAWLGRGLLEVLDWCWDMDLLPKLIRGPGKLIVRLTVRPRRYAHVPASTAEYVVGALFWIGLLFGLYWFLS